MHRDCFWGIAEIESIINIYSGVFPQLLQALIINSGDPVVLAIVPIYVDRTWCEDLIISNINSKYILKGKEEKTLKIG